MKFVIFDIDGTLTDTKEVEGRCFMRSFEQIFNIDIWGQKWGNFKHVTDWGITEEIIEQKLGRKPRQAEYDLMVSNFARLLQEERQRDNTQFREVKGAKTFFYELAKDKNIALGIATGAWKDSAKIKLDAVGINLAGICFSNSTDHKSREAITQDVIEQLKQKTGELPEEIIYFGDGEWDFKTCQKLGITFIGIDVRGDGKLTALGAKNVYRNFEDKIGMLSCFSRT